ncbi:Decaprenyl diphosphate synthase [Melia azedarach]|uniref:Decaprenyl diphosphate synthase n=1 Tax=Melia azedarach TaxID=155640 RepID=A0ACC1XMX2_MELAZ|nr:Decaprenyl diphosphate synthase [Melia azedarach]
MGLHMVALAKLNLLSSAAHGISPAILAGLVCPFVLKFTFSFRFIRQAYVDVLYASRLFVFQLGQIAFESEPAAGYNSRWERAIRLISQRVTHMELNEEIKYTLQKALQKVY